jgi:hypothetical protein
MEPHINWLAIALATIAPMVIGFIYYHPKVLGGVWMKANGFTLESVGNGPKPIMFLVCLLLSFMLAFWCWTQFADPHQTNIDAEGNPHDYTTFGHGVVHAVGYALLVVIPILGTMSVFEKRPFSWVWVNALYWFLTLATMCGIISAMR